MKMQIKEFADVTGVSVRTLHYYHEIGLLVPASVDMATGYRFYDETSLLRMQEILFYRELDFSLSSIKTIMLSPDYDRKQALSEQKQMLTMKKERLERLIFAIDDAMKGENIMTAFDNREIEAYKNEVRERWGRTEAYRQYEEKTKGCSVQKQEDVTAGLDHIMGEFASCMKRGETSGSDEAQNLVKKLQSYITEHYYVCTNEILSGLGQMYVSDERFKKNIDRHAEGAAEYICEAVGIYCRNIRNI